MKTGFFTLLMSALVLSSGCSKKPKIGLHEAAVSGDLDAVKKHIDVGTDLNEKESEAGNTPLHLATVYGHEDVAVALIEAGAKLELKNEDQATPLALAVLLCHPELLKTLLKKGAEPNPTGKDGTPLQVLVNLPWDYVKPMYDAIAEEHPEVDLDLFYIKKTRPEIAKILRDHMGTELAEKAPVADKAIRDAVVAGDVKSIKEYLADDGAVNATDDQGASLLGLAATFGKVDVAQILVDAKADVNQKKNDGTTPLYIAAFFCYPEIVTMLLENGADKNLTDNKGATALAAAEAPWDVVKPIYDFLNGLVFLPVAQPLDYERLKNTRPEIVKLLK